MPEEKHARVSGADHVDPGFRGAIRETMRAEGRPREPGGSTEDGASGADAPEEPRRTRSVRVHGSPRSPGIDHEKNARAEREGKFSALLPRDAVLFFVHDPEEQPDGKGDPEWETGKRDSAGSPVLPVFLAGNNRKDFEGSGNLYWFHAGYSTLFLPDLDAPAHECVLRNKPRA